MTEQRKRTIYRKKCNEGLFISLGGNNYKLLLMMVKWVIWKVTRICLSIWYSWQEFRNKNPKVRPSKKLFSKDQVRKSFPLFVNNEMKNFPKVPPKDQLRYLRDHHLYTCNKEGLEEGAGKSTEGQLKWGECIFSLCLEA